MSVHGRTSRRGGFTLVELLAVVVIMGIIAVSVIPTISHAGEARRGVARDEVVRMLEYARSRAGATGEPCGVGFDTGDPVVTLVTLTDGGVVSIIDPVTGVSKDADLGALFDGVSVSAFENGDGTTAAGVVWFDYLAAPHVRDSDGVFDAWFDRDATVTLSSGATIVVYKHSGVIEAP